MFILQNYHSVAKLWLKYFKSSYLTLTMCCFYLGHIYLCMHTHFRNITVPVVRINGWKLYINLKINMEGSPCGVKAKVLCCNFNVSKFKLQSCSLTDLYPWEKNKLPYPPSYGLNSTTTVLLQGRYWH